MNRQKLLPFVIGAAGVALTVIIIVVAMQADGQSEPTGTPTSVTPAATLTGGGTDPYFPDQGYSEGYFYSPFGTITGVSVGTDVRNGGEPGKAFVTVTCPGRNWLSSTVFDMSEGETVKLTARFGVISSSFSCEFEWTARAALPGDVSKGEIEVERQ